MGGVWEFVNGALVSAVLGAVFGGVILKALDRIKPLGAPSLTVVPSGTSPVAPPSDPTSNVKVIIRPVIRQGASGDTGGS